MDELPATITIRTHLQRPVPLAELRAMYEAEGWWPERTDDDLLTVLEAGPALSAWDGKDLVGFVRSVTDGVTRGYVEDLVVDSGHRGRGIGAACLPHCMTSSPVCTS